MPRVPKGDATRSPQAGGGGSAAQTRLVLIHLSDLHFGSAHRFPIAEPSQNTALGVRYGRALSSAASELGVSLAQALVFVTGDITNAADPDEFTTAAQVLQGLAGELGIASHRFVTCPGNHDINWDDCQIAEATARKNKTPPQVARAGLDRHKLSEYRNFLRLLHGDSVDATVRALPREARRQDFEDLKLSVIALNACERESHRNMDHFGSVSLEQSQGALDSWAHDPREGWIRILCMHHNPDRTSPENLNDTKNWLSGLPELDEGSVARIVADVAGCDGREGVRRVAADAKVSLLLHGHQHESDLRSWKWPRDGETLILASGSAGVDSSHLPGLQPNQVRLMVLEPRKRRFRVRTLVWDPRARQPGSALPGDFVAGAGEHDYHEGPLYVPPGYLTSTRANAGSGVPASQSRVHEFIQTYRKRLSARWADWELKGMAAVGAMGKPVAAGLDDMYQPLRLGVSHNGLRQALFSTETPQPIDVEALLKGPRAVLVRGPAGAGKTTWMRYSFRRLLDHPNAVPFMLLVRDVALRWSQPGCSGEDRSLDACLRSDVGAYMGAGWDQDIFRRVLTAIDGPVPVLLVDGWDELGEDGQKLREMLLGFMQAHPRIRVVVSTRPWGDGVPDGTQGFHVLEVQPFTHDEIDSFARRFFRVCYAFDEATADSEVVKFLSALRASNEATALAGTALFLTMMLVVSRSKPLPDKRHQLYQECLTTLLKDRPDTWKREGVQRRHDWYRPDDGEQRWKAVARLALELQAKGYSGEARRAVVAREDELVEALPSSWSADERRGFVHWLVGEAALLTDRSDGTYTFAHLSFQEYLSARQLKANVAGASSASPVVERLRTPSWWETLLLYAAEIGSENDDRADSILDALIDEGRAGLSLAGMILADGTGTESRFERWTEAWVAALEWGPEPEALYRCCQAWGASQQDGRKARLVEVLDLAGSAARWRHWERLLSFSVSISSALIRPPIFGLAKVAGAARLHIGNARGAGVGVARVLFLSDRLEFARRSGEPDPAGWMSLLLMQWPSRRRRLAARLQSALLAGAPRDAVLQIAKFTRQAMSRPADVRSVLARLRAVASRLHRDSRLDIQDLGDRQRALGHRLLEYWCELTRVHTPGARDSLDYPLSVFLEEVLARGGSTEWIQRLSDRSGGFPAYIAHSLEGLLRFSGPWVHDYLTLEIANIAAWAGPFLLEAHSDNTPEESLILEATMETCGFRFPGLGGGAVPQQRANRAAARPIQPVWTALASHLAGRSSQAERALLTDLAAYPEKAKEPLSWALQYVVRGDLVLDDGTTVTLDEFLLQSGIESLPLLDEPGPIVRLPRNDRSDGRQVGRA